jgi:hypothetical protein
MEPNWAQISPIAALATLNRRIQESRMNVKGSGTVTVLCFLSAIHFTTSAVGGWNEDFSPAGNITTVTPLANLQLTLLDKVGVRLDSFADSQGKGDELFAPLSV